MVRTNSQSEDSNPLTISPSFACLSLNSNDRGQSSAKFFNLFLNSALLRKVALSGHSAIISAINGKVLDHKEG
jgi:hypothetical protein